MKTFNYQEVNHDELFNEIDQKISSNLSGDLKKYIFGALCLAFYEIDGSFIYRNYIARMRAIKKAVDPMYLGNQELKYVIKALSILYKNESTKAASRKNPNAVNTLETEEKELRKSLRAMGQKKSLTPGVIFSFKKNKEEK